MSGYENWHHHRNFLGGKIRQSSTLTTAHKLQYCMRLLHRDNDSCEFIVIVVVGLCLGGRGDVKKGGIGG